MYAQTNSQLYNQLQDNGYSGWELSCVRDSYELAMHLSTCLYRPSGKTNIAHFVGTASILCSLRAPVEVVAAGLLHSVYFHGDFGSIRKGMLSSHRKQVRDAVGQDVEEYIARYAMLEWNPQNIPAIHNKLHELDMIDRYVFLIRLADWLEDHLDQGILYCPNAEGRLKYTHSRNDIVKKMAVELGLPTLAAE
jgi:(p)ppGpp synthase/HD superfamily hydrolase